MIGWGSGRDNGHIEITKFNSQCGVTGPSYVGNIAEELVDSSGSCR